MIHDLLGRYHVDGCHTAGFAYCQNDGMAVCEVGLEDLELLN